MDWRDDKLSAAPSVLRHVKTQNITDTVGRFPLFCSHLTIFFGRRGRRRKSRERETDERSRFRTRGELREKTVFVAKLSIHNE